MRCTNCGWDNAEHNTRCEKCNAPLGNSAGSDSDTPVWETVRETVREGQPLNKTIIESVEEPVVPRPPEPKQPSSSEPVYGGTIPPWMQFGASAMCYCKLTPMPSAPNEKHLPKEVEFKGEYTELNRGNLDPDNFTISQKLQAVLTCKDGKWFIKDHSPYKTTYILASEEVPLKDGDVILMGSRRFVFTEE